MLQSLPYQLTNKVLKHTAIILTFLASTVKGQMVPHHISREDVKDKKGDIPKCSIVSPIKGWLIIPSSRNDTSTNVRQNLLYDFCLAAYLKQTISKDFMSINIANNFKRYKWVREWYIWGGEWEEL